VYELLHEELYYPGEQIMSIHQRSPICKAYAPLYKDSISGLKQRIEHNKMRNRTGGENKKEKTSETPTLNTMYQNMTVHIKGDRDRKAPKRIKSGLSALKELGLASNMKKLFMSKRQPPIYSLEQFAEKFAMDEKNSLAFKFCLNGTSRLA